MERVEGILKRLPLRHIEMNPGDVLFFDCNLLHRSDQNRSQSPRWSLICRYNAARNDPYKDSEHPRYTPLNRVRDSAIREAGLHRFADTSKPAAWLADEKDRTSRKLEADL